MKKSKSNAGKPFHDHRATQRRRGEDKSGTKRLKGNRIAFEALLPAVSCSTREPQACMGSASFDRILHQIGDMAEGAVSSGLILPDDLQAAMYTLSGPSPNGQLSDNDAAIKADAQEIACAAMKAEDETMACKLAKHALQIDPDCVDALVLLSNLNTRTLRDAIDCLQFAVAVGERSLGEAFINEDRGYFWLQMETRPYMRALQSLAGAFFCAKRNQDAVRIYERMLELNPKDNQGARYPLIGLCIEVANLNRAAELLKSYEHDRSAMFEWARMLERLLSGDQSGANRALIAARKANGYVELLLTCKHPWPDELQGTYSSGSEEEAAFCFRYLNGVLKKQRRAFSWLLGQLAADGRQPVQSAEQIRKMIQ